MLKHLFFLFIGVLAMCIPTMAHAEEMPTSVDIWFYRVFTVKTGDNVFRFGVMGSGKKISVTYGKTTINDILDQVSYQELDPEKYRRVESGVDGDDEKDWYLWRDVYSGRFSNETRTKASDVITEELLTNAYTKGIGGLYEYIGKTTIDVVNEEGAKVGEVDLAQEINIPYTSEYPCWYYEEYKDGQWEQYYYYNELLKSVVNPDETVNLDNYRIKLSAHNMYDEYLVCMNCHKHIVTKASDFDTLWELYEDEELWGNEISIESDIDLSSYTPTHALLPFEHYEGMTIDGHGHTISNFKGNYPFASDYCTYDNQTIKNLTIDNFDITLTIADEKCETKEGENDDVYVLIMGDNNDISNCTFTGKVAIEGEEGKNYIPCLGYEYLNISNTTVSINGKVEISTGIAEVEADGSIYVRGREIIATENVRIYNLMGEDVTSLNGMLNKGVYIVKGSKATKVVVR